MILYHFVFFQISCPYASLVMILPELYWDNFFDFPFLWATIAFHLGTTISAAVSAHHLKFSRYRFDCLGNARGVFWGCLFYWLPGYFYFLRNRDLVLKGKAPPKGDFHPASRRFFLGALAGVMFWLVFFAAVIPSMITSRTRLEQDFAVRMLKRYAKAQNAFKVENLAAVPGNTKNGGGYCDNFRNLHYGKDRNGKTADLLYKDVADAFAGPAGGAPTSAPHADTPKPFKGFCFLEDPYIAENALWDTHFGLVAYPQTEGHHGTWIWTDGTKVTDIRNTRDYRLFWIGNDGTVLTALYRSDDRLELLTAEQSPLHPGMGEYWRVYARETTGGIGESIPIWPQQGEWEARRENVSSSIDQGDRELY